MDSRASRLQSVSVQYKKEVWLSILRPLTFVMWPLGGTTPNFSLQWYYRRHNFRPLSAKSPLEACWGGQYVWGQSLISRPQSLAHNDQLPERSAASLLLCCVKFTLLVWKSFWITSQCAQFTYTQWPPHYAHLPSISSVPVLLGLNCSKNFCWNCSLKCSWLDGTADVLQDFTVIFLEPSSDDEGGVTLDITLRGVRSAKGWTWSAAMLKYWSGFDFHMTVLAWSCYKLKGMVPSMVSCCCSPSPSRLSELCTQRCPSAHRCCTELLFACLCPSCYFSI